jgi:hypothetical protein
MNRELTVAYRIYPGLSKKPAYFRQKVDLARVALSSFSESLANVDYTLHAILDDCPQEYVDLFRDLFPVQRLRLERHSPKLGNEGTWMRQIEILTAQRESDLVLLAEDDYLWTAGSVRAHVDLHRDCDIVDFSTPYDHPGYYYGPSKVPPDRHGLLLHGGLHWRTAACTTLTFFARTELLRQTRATFGSFARGSYDMSLWIALTKHFIGSPAFVRRGFHDPLMKKVFMQAWRYNFGQCLLGRRYTLWSPIPALATHLEGAELAIGVDWDTLVARYGDFGRSVSAG